MFSFRCQSFLPIWDPQSFGDVSVERNIGTVGTDTFFIQILTSVFENRHKAKTCVFLEPWIKSRAQKIGGIFQKKTEKNC